MERKIEVLHIISNLSLKSGVASVIVNYYRNMDRNKINFSIIYFDYVEGETYSDELTQKYGVNIYQFHRSTIVKEWNEFCKENYGEYDILHNHQLFLAPILLNAKKQLGVKAIFSHAHVTKYSDSFAKSIRNAALSFPSRFISDKLLACSDEAGFAMFGKPYEDKGYLMRNAINVDKFAFDLSIRKRMRCEIKAENKFVVGHVGNMTPQKNHLFLLSVFNDLIQKDSNCLLVLIGDGYLRKEIERKVDEYGISDKVVFLGVKNNVNDYLQALDVFAFPSLFEGLGIAIIEAQANGLSCVYSDQVPLDADVILDNNVRLSLKAASKDWADAIYGAKRNNSHIKEKLVAAGYDIASATDGYIDLCNSVLT